MPRNRFEGEEIIPYNDFKFKKKSNSNKYEEIESENSIFQENLPLESKNPFRVSSIQSEKLFEGTDAPAAPTTFKSTNKSTKNLELNIGYPTKKRGLYKDLGLGEPKFETKVVDYTPGRRPTFEEEQEARRKHQEYLDGLTRKLQEEARQAEIRRVAAEAERRAKYVPQVASFKQNPAQVEVRYPTLAHNDYERSSLKYRMVQLFKDKGFGLQAGLALAERGVLGALFNDLVLRSDNRRNDFQYNYWFYQALDNRYKGYADSFYNDRYWLNAKPEYEGTPDENVKVDRAIAESTDKTNSRRQFSGRGATRVFYLDPTDRRVFRNFVGDVPIVVMGGGPAGLMATREMIEMGFDSRNITVIDKTGEYGGIWNQKNVAGGSKNNPFQFKFEDLTLDAAPGAGSTVTKFLERVEDPQGRRFYERLPQPVRGTVVAIKPGDLQHSVTYKTNEGDKTITAPIVINALGNGKPLDPNREGYMTSDTPREAGIRWQQILTPEKAERYRGKTLIFIGLGNSTAEMLVQLRELNAQGFNIDYRVVTHYPSEAVADPEQEVEKDGKKYRVFRDTKAPNLVKWEADLPDAREVYLKALDSNKIVPDVTHWHLEDKKMTVTTKSGSQKTFDCEQLFTLIGYGHDPEMLRAMGMTVTDEYLGTVAYDYDGEIQKQPGARGRERVYPGYFGLGAVLRSNENPNAVVIPGVMHRMHDLLFGAAVRAAEYKVRQSNQGRHLARPV